MTDNYFDNVSNNEKKNLACEIILELGDKEYWDTKDENFKKKMSEIYKKQWMIQKCLYNRKVILKSLKFAVQQKHEIKNTVFFVQ